MAMLKLARPFTSIPEFPANSPEKRMIPVKETSTVVYRQNVFAAGSPSVENVNVATNLEKTGIERRLKPEALVYPPADLPPKHVLPVACEPKLIEDEDVYVDYLSQEKSRDACVSKIAFEVSR